MDIKYKKVEVLQTRSLRSLVRVSKVGSFAKAADQLNMTLSALSMQMKALEVELGVGLFDRSVRPPRLTPIGRAIVETAVPLLQREDSLLKICARPIHLLDISVLVSSQPLPLRLLPKFLQTAKSDAPLGSFEFETGLSRTLQGKVMNGQLDAAVVTDAGGLPDGLVGLVLREEPFVFAAHKSLLADGLKGLLSTQTFFHFMPDTGIGKLIAKEMLQHKRPQTTQTIVLDNLEATMECVSAGLGFTLLPAPDVDRYKSHSVESIGLPQAPARKLVLATAQGGPFASRETALANLFE